jgi:hypothetical protein
MLLISGCKDVMKNIVPERAICMKEDDGKEYVLAYLNHRLLNTETRYVFIADLCLSLSLYYACTKFWSYLLYSTCVLASQTDVVRYMLQQPILSARIKRWLITYGLTYESLLAMRGEIIANFIIDHRFKSDKVSVGP